ncbi:hypothetical protein ACW4TU_44670 [Streptomyces sp. QTS52]
MSVRRSHRRTGPYGSLIDLARDIDTGHANGYDMADRIRSWRI